MKKLSEKNILNSFVAAPSQPAAISPAPLKKLQVGPVHCSIEPTTHARDSLQQHSIYQEPGSVFGACPDCMLHSSMLQTFLYNDPVLQSMLVDGSAAKQAPHTLHAA